MLFHLQDNLEHVTSRAAIGYLLPSRKAENTSYGGDCFVSRAGLLSSVTLSSDITAASSPLNHGKWLKKAFASAGATADHLGQHLCAFREPLLSARKGKIPCLQEGRAETRAGNGQ